MDPRKAVVEDTYFSTTTSTKHRVRIEPDAQQAGGWMGNEGIVDKIDDARVFDSPEEASTAATTAGYEVTLD